MIGGLDLTSLQANADAAAVRWDEILTVVGVGNPSNTVPAQYGLQQNYPNPFNPATNISYELPEAAFVSIKVYNLLGGEVATLVNREQAAGAYEVGFDATGLPSGVYFYRLNAGPFSATRKLLLLR
jgi:hypothetical protein